MQTPPQAPSGRPDANGAPSLVPAIAPSPGGARRPDVARPLPDPVAIQICAIPDAVPPYDDELPTAAPPTYDDEAPAETTPTRADVLAARIIAGLDGAARPQGSADAKRAGDGRQAPDGQRAGDLVRASNGQRASGQRAGDLVRASAGQRASGQRIGGGRRVGDPDRKRALDGQRAEGRQPEAVRPGGLSPDDQGDGWPSKFAQVLAETLAGSRPPAQITPWTTERARSHIRRLGPLLAAGQRPFVHRIVTSLPASDVMEMSVVVGFGSRVRALAIRLERAESRPASPGVPGRQARWLCTAVEAA
jgi:hypothetical protein